MVRLTFLVALVVAVAVRGPGAVVGVVLLGALFVPLERLVAFRRPLDHPDDGVERPVQSRRVVGSPR